MKKTLLWATVLAVATTFAGEDVLARHQAFRKEIAVNPAAAQNYLKDQDVEIRRFALYTLVKNNAPDIQELLFTAVKDTDDMVRLTAVSALSSMAQGNPAIAKIMDEVARTDDNNQVRQIALKFSWPYHRETTLLRDDKEWDHDVVVVKRFDIPDDNWKIQKDLKIDGHRNGWFKPEFDDSKWLPIKVGHWEVLNVLPDYDGFAWYRIKFKMPEKMDFTSIELAFGAVDESAWVWLNGVYLGSHDIGPSGWNQPFALDCRKEAKWGEENVLVVRVQDTSSGGGIWKPISVEILK